MSKKLLLIILFSSLTFIFTYTFNLALAQQPTASNPETLNEILNQAGQKAQYNTQVQSQNEAIPNIIGQIVAVVLGFVGSIFLVLTIYSGLQWMTAGGNEDKVTKARTRMINSIMGLAITIAAYFITWLISTTLLGTS